jgi:hypothetical protein
MYNPIDVRAFPPPMILPILPTRLLALLLAAAPSLYAADAPASQSELDYTKAIEGRTDDILSALSLDDPVKRARVRETMIARYRELRAWHDANGARRSELAKLQTPDAVAELAGIERSRQASHDAFLSRLAADLTPAQVDTVKDRLTYNVVNVTYDAYLDQLPQLTDPQKARIRQFLLEARELAMDEGSSKDKHAVFGKYKGRINNYLSKQGYDLKQAEKEWAERRKARARTGD